MRSAPSREKVRTSSWPQKHQPGAELVILTPCLFLSFFSEGYSVLCRLEGYQQVDDDERPKGLGATGTRVFQAFLICVACLFVFLTLFFFLCFASSFQILMSASTTPASTASASTQTALSAVNAPWDTIWTSAASDVKVSSFPLLSGTLFLSRLSNDTFSACGCRHQRMRGGQSLRQRHLHKRGGRLRVCLRGGLRTWFHDDL